MPREWMDVSTNEWLDRVLSLDPQAVYSHDEIRQAEIEILASMTDLIMYAVDPSVYEAQPFLNWDSDELLSLEEPRLSLIPSLTNEFAGMIKDSTLISVTGFIHDVMWRATRVGRAEFKNVEAFIVAAVIYLLLFMIVSFGGKVLRNIMTTSKPGAEVSA